MGPENLSVNNLKRDLSNDATVNPPSLFSSVNTIKGRSNFPILSDFLAILKGGGGGLEGVALIGHWAGTYSICIFHLKLK